MTGLEITVMVLLLLGFVFLTGASIGMLRLPDCFSRAHAAGLCDSFGAQVCFVGLAIYNLGGGDLDFARISVSVKILLVGIVLMVTSPTAMHVMFRGAYQSGLRPWTRAKDEAGGQS